MWLAERGKVKSDVPESMRAPPSRATHRARKVHAPRCPRLEAGAGRFAETRRVNAIQVHLAAAATAATARCSRHRPASAGLALNCESFVAQWLSPETSTDWKPGGTVGHRDRGGEAVHQSQLACIMSHGADGWPQPKRRHGDYVALRRSAATGTESPRRFNQPGLAVPPARERERERERVTERE